MAIAAVGTPVSAYAAAVTKTVVAGSLVVFFASSEGNTLFTAPTKTGTCTIGAITQVVNYTNGSNETVGIWWMEITGSGTLTLTITGGGSDKGGSIHEYSGAVLVSPVDASGTNTANSSAPSVALTGILSGSVVVMIAAEEDVGPRTYSATAPYVMETQESAHTHATFDYIVPSDGDYTPACSFTGGAGTWAAGAAAFLAAAGGVVIPVFMNQYRQRRN